MLALVPTSLSDYSARRPSHQILLVLHGVQGQGELGQMGCRDSRLKLSLTVEKSSLGGLDLQHRRLGQGGGQVISVDFVTEAVEVGTSDICVRGVWEEVMWGSLWDR